MFKKILKTISIAILISIICIILVVGVIIFVETCPLLSKIITILLLLGLAYSMANDQDKISVDKKIKKNKNIKKHKEKPFNSVDYAFRQLGFSKVEDGSIVVAYQKYDDDFDYMHRIELVHKANGNSLILSFQADVNKDGFNNTVGLTSEEVKL